MDGTLLPNTGMPPRDGCLQRTQTLLLNLQEAGCPVCFISGRYLNLARQGQQEFCLPEPDYWVCNVGTEIYDRRGALDLQWQALLGPAFNHHEMRLALQDLELLTLQEEQKQGPHKLSFYTPGEISRALVAAMLDRMDGLRPDLRLVVSVEESTGRGLLDIMPGNSGKAAALHYLAGRRRFAPRSSFFAGDSGNDRDALLSGVCGTLVGNATDAVRSDLQQTLSREDTTGRIHFSEASYGDGIIEGLSHFGFVESM